MATIAKIIKNKSGFMLALLLIFFIGTAAVMAKTLTDDKKDVTVDQKISTKLVNQTWHYVSGNPTLASSYSSAPVEECANGEEVICEILAPADPSDSTKPQMTTQVVNDINSALSGTPSTNATVQSFRLE